MLLLAAFVGSARGLSFTSQDYEAAGIRTGSWQNDVVGPLRALRTRLKDGPPPAPNTATTELRDRVKIHVIITPSAHRTIAQETDYGLDDVRELADRLHHPRDIGAALSSGSFVTTGMLVAPCSVKTLSGIANSYNEELVVRAADVCLKERRRVVLILRETPLHAGHIDLMARATASGAVIMPPVPAFYTLPKSLDDVVDQTVSRALELLDVAIPGIKRWNANSVAPDE